MEIHIGDRVAEVELVSKEDNKVVLTIDGKPFEADVVMAENGTCNILMDGRSANAQLIRKENGKSYKVTSDCRIKEILVQEGDNITGDQTLITLEPIA